MFVTAGTSRRASCCVSAATNARAQRRRCPRRLPPTRARSAIADHCPRSTPQARSDLFATTTRGDATPCPAAAAGRRLSAVASRRAPAGSRDATSRAAAARAMPSSSTGSSAASSHAGRVDECHRNPVDVHRLGQQIARRPRHLGDDGAPGAGKALNRLDLPAFGRPAITTCSPFANQPPAPRRREQRRDVGGDRSRSTRGRGSASTKVIALVRKVQRRLEPRREIEQSLRRCRGSRRQRALELIERRARLQRRHRVDQIAHRLGLHQIEPTVQVGAQRELAGPGEPRAGVASPPRRSHAAAPGCRAR